MTTWAKQLKVNGGQGWETAQVGAKIHAADKN